MYLKHHGACQVIQVWPHSIDQSVWPSLSSALTHEHPRTTSIHGSSSGKELKKRDTATVDGIWLVLEIRPSNGISWKDCLIPQMLPWSRSIYHMNEWLMRESVCGSNWAAKSQHRNSNMGAKFQQISGPWSNRNVYLPTQKSWTMLVTARYLLHCKEQWSGESQSETVHGVKADAWDQSLFTL